jgi:hypothetical protein
MLSLAGRNPSSPQLPLPFDIRVSRIERSDHRRESADDDALRPCDCPRVPRETEQGKSVQMPLLSWRESSSRCKEGLFVISYCMLLIRDPGA